MTVITNIKQHLQQALLSLFSQLLLICVVSSISLFCYPVVILCCYPSYLVLPNPSLHLSCHSQVSPPYLGPFFIHLWVTWSEQTRIFSEFHHIRMAPESESQRLRLCWGPLLSSHGWSTHYIHIVLRLDPWDPKSCFTGIVWAWRVRKILRWSSWNLRKRIMGSTVYGARIMFQMFGILFQVFGIWV